MTSCFLKHGLLHQPPQLPYALFFIIITITSKELIFKTESSNCTIHFNSDPKDGIDGAMKMNQCARRTCLRNLVNGNCANLQEFVLEEKKCYKECCGGNEFDIVKCENFNKERESRKSSSEATLLIVLIPSLTGLLIALFIFLFAYIKCCHKTTPSTIINKHEAYWKKCDFNNERKCKKCDQTGAFIMLPCGSFFHLKCMSENIEWKCTHCAKEIKKFKFFCPSCFNKCIVIQAQNFIEMDKKIFEMYELHPGRCLGELTEELDTDRKITFTESTE